MPRRRRDPLANDSSSSGVRIRPRREDKRAKVPSRADQDWPELPAPAAEVPPGLPRDREDPEQ